MKMDSLQEYTCPFCGKRHSKAVVRCPEKNKHVPEAFKLEGEVLARKYRIEHRIAEGGMGVIYEATHLAIGRKVAIKFLHSEIRTQDDVITRFQNEARLAASIGHRNIVDILDMGMFREKFYYIVMEFLQGEDLRTILIRRQVLARAEAVDLALEILGGLRAAHLKSVIHRDLKPENVYLVEEPGGERYVKLLDFGVSRLIDLGENTDVRLTASGTVFGTPRYIPPEQARGELDVDQRADLYSTGAILYEMLSGFPLCESNGHNELMVEIMTKKPVPLRERNAAIPAGLARAVMRSVEKSPDDRFQSAEAFMAALAPYSSTGARPRDPLAAAGPGTAGGVETGHQALKVLARMDTLPPVQTAGEADDAAAEGEEELPPGRIDQASTLRPRESGAARGMKRKMLLAAVPVMFVLVAIGLAATIFMVQQKKRGGARDGALPVKTVKEAVAKAPPAEVAIENLPPRSKVYIDGILHPERPILAERSADPREVKVVVDGSVVLDEKVVVAQDVTIPFEVRESAGTAGKPPQGTGEQAGGKGKTGKKKAGGKGQGTGGMKEIDVDYPE